jgi:hypothetical protein
LIRPAPDVRIIALSVEDARDRQGALAQVASSDGSGAVQLGLISAERTAEEFGRSIDMVTRAGRGTRISVVIR